MIYDGSELIDEVIAAAGYNRADTERIGLHGLAIVELVGPGGNLKQRLVIPNLITQVGDQVYGERGSGAAAPTAPTGMRLGTGGATAAAKTGPGAAIVTYTTGSNKVFDSTPASSLNGSSRRITYVTTWPAGTVTANSMDEAVITNETGPTNVAGTAANTIARFVMSPVVNKGALDQLVITWTNDLLGA
jgi:hypothetical protein